MATPRCERCEPVRVDEGRKHHREGGKMVYNVHTLLIDLKSCSVRKDLQWGKRIHAKAIETRHESNIHVATALIRMYAKCRSMVHARSMFDSIKKPSIVSWNVLLLGYAENGDGLTALNLFSRMKSVHGCSPNSVTYVAALKACTPLAVGQAECLNRVKEIHSEIGCHLDVFVQNTLIGVYAKSGSMVSAHCVFDSIQMPDVVSWNVLILGYAENGKGLLALELFSRMKARSYVPDSASYVAALKACTSLAVNRDGKGRLECLKRGREIHSEIDCHLGISVHNTLIDMYAKSGSMVDARCVFDKIHKPDVVSWNVLLLGYAENGDGLTALELFTRMKSARLCAPNSATYVAALKACTSLAMKQKGSKQGECLKQGRQIHSEIGRHLDHHVLSTLIDMYAKCGSMGDARSVFDSIEKPDVVLWNVLLLGYAENCAGLIALDLFARMKAGFAPTSVTYVAALKACASLAVNGDGNKMRDSLELGKEIHLEIGCCLDHCMQNTLVDMYAKCGSMEDAKKVFDSIQNPDVVSWTTLLLGYVENGDELTALNLFTRMKADCVPNSVTYVAALKACTSLAVKGDADAKGEWLERGKQIHSEIGCHLDDYVQSTLIDMYTKCGSMVEARCVFDSIMEPDDVCWTTLLLGYADNGEGSAALELFSRMKSSGCVTDSVSYVAALKACGLIGALDLGREFHSEVSDYSTGVVTCLVGFYAKCGSMVEAQEVFHLHSSLRDIPTWNALLAGHGSFGDSSSVFNLFEAMQDQGYQPDSVTFLCVLSCCSHAGLVEKAKQFFDAMPVQYGITPTVMHYNCMVDILGRANRLNEAISVLQKMPDAVTWMTLLSACRKWKNVEIGRWAFESLVAMDKNNASAYALMSHIYGSRGMWEEQERLAAQQACSS